MWKAVNCTQYARVYHPICSVELYKEMRVNTPNISTQREERSSSSVFMQAATVNFCYRELPRPVLWLDDPKKVPNVSQLYGFSHQVLKHNMRQRKATVFNREHSTSWMPFDPINSALISSLLSSARFLQRFFKHFAFLQSISNTENDPVEDSRASLILQLHTGYFLKQNWITQM